MTRPVAHMGDQIGRTAALRGRRRWERGAKLRGLSEKLVHQRAQGTDDLDVGSFAVAPNVVDLTRSAIAQRLCDRLAVIRDVKPVAYLQAVAIHRQRVTSQNI